MFIKFGIQVGVYGWDIRLGIFVEGIVCVYVFLHGYELFTIMILRLIIHVYQNVRYKCFCSLHKEYPSD